jgi:serine/threonine protein kinase
MDCANIIKLKDVVKTLNNIYIVMELVNGGDLEMLKQIRDRPFSEVEARNILIDLVNAFKTFNDLKVMHRDLKLPNILI